MHFESSFRKTWSDSRSKSLLTARWSLQKLSVPGHFFRDKLRPTKVKGRFLFVEAEAEADGGIAASTSLLESHERRSI